MVAQQTNRHVLAIWLIVIQQQVYFVLHRLANVKRFLNVATSLVPLSIVKLALVVAANVMLRKVSFVLHRQVSVLNLQLVLAMVVKI